MTEIKKNVTKKETAVATPKKEVIKKDNLKKEMESVKKETAKKTTVKTVAKTSTKTVAPKAKVVTQKVKKDSTSTYATGKRKNAIAKLWLTKGEGKVIINGKPAEEYLKRAILNVIISQPFGKTETEGKFDVECTVLGGGLSGQAGAVKHAISKALQILNPELRAPLKSAGFLTRDSRVVERKKPGLKKARKGQVFQKR